MFVSQTSKNTFEKWVVFLSFLERPSGVLDDVMYIKQFYKFEGDSMYVLLCMLHYVCHSVYVIVYILEYVC